MPSVYCSNGQHAIGVNKPNTIHKLVLTHEAGNTSNFKMYVVVDGTYYEGTPSRTYSHLGASDYAGNLFVGGNDKANFEGTIEDFAIYGEVLTEEEIKSYLGV